MWIDYEKPMMWNDTDLRVALVAFVEEQGWGNEVRLTKNGRH